MPTEEVAAVRRLLDAFNRGDFSALDELDPRAELQDEPLGAHDCLVTRWFASGVGKRSGIRVDMDGYCVFRMRGAKVRRVEFYETQREALEAAKGRVPQRKK